MINSMTPIVADSCQLPKCRSEQAGLMARLVTVCMKCTPTKSVHKIIFKFNNWKRILKSSGGF